MLYNPISGKRVKEPTNCINWVHTVKKMPDFHLKQCFFGEHLLKGNTTPAAIVESEKSAIIASVYLPQFIWVAVGSLTNLNAEKCKILKGRSVVLFPDLNGFEKWKTKAEQLSDIAHFEVSDLLEKKATEAEKKQGLDIVDYLINFDYKQFSLYEKPEQISDYREFPEIPPFDELPMFSPATNTDYNSNTNLPFRKADDWSAKISELEKFFSNHTFPNEPIKLNCCTTILNIPRFIESNLSIVKAQNGNQTYYTYLNQLIEFKNLFDTKYFEN